MSSEREKIIALFNELPKMGKGYAVNFDLAPEMYYYLAEEQEMGQARYGTLKQKWTKRKTYIDLSCYPFWQVVQAIDKVNSQRKGKPFLPFPTFVTRYPAKFYSPSERELFYNELK